MLVSSDLDLTDFGCVGVGVLDGIKAISAQLGLGFGLSLAKKDIRGEICNFQWTALPRTDCNTTPNLSSEPK